MWLLLPVMFTLAGCRQFPEPKVDVVKHVQMRKWAIEPERIEVPANAEVELILTSADVEHGLSIPKLDIREPVQPGKPAVIFFKAPAAGEYPMKCSVLCGRGHDDMRGVLVVRGQ